VGMKTWRQKCGRNVNMGGKNQNPSITGVEDSGFRINQKLESSVFYSTQSVQKIKLLAYFIIKKHTSFGKELAARQFKPSNSKTSQEGSFCC